MQIREARGLDAAATSDDPVPALDAMIHDHQATGWKTLSVVVHDCVGGNCFPIDSNVQKELDRHQLPANERRLASLLPATSLNPRQVARVFYQAGGRR